MKCEKCGGHIERVAYNCDWNLMELWDCMCENCGHMMLSFPPECKCGGILEFNCINEFIESGVEDKEVVVLSCNKCLKDYLKICSNEDIDELNDCINEYLHESPDIEDV